MADKKSQSQTENRQFDDETCERYLLGELSEAEREQFEEAYFADDAFFERFLAVKDELLDAFARGELSEEKHKRIEKHFSATEPRRRQIIETKDFIGAITAVSANETAIKAAASPKQKRQSLFNFFKLRPFAWQFALAAVLLTALGGIWVFVRQQQRMMHDEQAFQQPTPAPTTVSPINENNNAAPSPTPANVNQLPVDQNVAPTPTTQTPIERPSKIPTAQIASVLLLPVALRDINDANTLRLDSNKRVARLHLVFKSNDYRNYSAAITTIEGANVWRQDRLKAVGKSVTLQFPPTILRGQDYIVTLTGRTAAGQTETIGEYYFRVERIPAQNTQPLTPQP